MIQYKAGYKFVGGGVHAQVLDFPAAISCGADLDDARRMLGVALIDVAETLLELGEPLPRPDPSATDPEMDLEEPIYLHLSASSAVTQGPAGVVVP
jgi:predicted RNase H-like HicB family nuclease